MIHQIRNSLKYVVWKDRKAFTTDLKTVYQASTREEAEANLLKLEEIWGRKYGSAIKSWRVAWGGNPICAPIVHRVPINNYFHDQLADSALSQEDPGKPVQCNRFALAQDDKI